MNYDGRAKPPYGRNRDRGAAHRLGDLTGGSYAVIRKGDKSFVSRFDTHEEAAAEVVRLESTTGEKFAIRKLA